MSNRKIILITGGCGFIGTNVAEYYLKNDHLVIIIDNLSRDGSKENLRFLKNSKNNNNLLFKKIDILNKNKVFSVFKKYKPSKIIHLAAQTTVLNSIKDPVRDFMTNALGTLNILEGTKKYCPSSILIYSSTNKVYGGLNYINLIEEVKRYSFDVDLSGISEVNKLSFETPYGCSKGCGDQYVIDYRKNFGLKTCVLRQSCIYGPHQFGMEEQGWLAWFVLASEFCKKINIWGNGKQVRDVLYVDDLIRAYELVFNNYNGIKEGVYNIGGGLSFSLSLLESLEIIEKLIDKKIDVNFKEFRPSDQKIYISNNSLIKSELNWEPTTSPSEGINKLYSWVMNNRDNIHKIQKNK